MLNPRVSICIPAYNQPVYFKNALESALSQTFEDFEIIITDDSTNDSIRSVTDNYSDKRIKYFKNKERLGSPENWNKAIKLASGKYIKILHHDDWFPDENCLSGFVQLLDENKSCDMGHSATYVCDPAGKVKRIHRTKHKQVMRIKKNPEFLLGGNVIGAPSAVIFRKEVPVIFDENLKWFVDIDFYISILKGNPNFAYTDLPLISTTDGDESQITYSKDIKTVEFFEWHYLYNKIKPKPSIKYYKAYSKILKKNRINSIKDIEALDLFDTLPGFVKFAFFHHKLKFLIKEMATRPIRKQE